MIDEKILEIYEKIMIYYIDCDFAAPNDKCRFCNEVTFKSIENIFKNEYPNIEEELKND